MKNEQLELLGKATLNLLKEINKTPEGRKALMERMQELGKIQRM